MLIKAEGDLLDGIPGVLGSIRFMGGHGKMPLSGRDFPYAALAVVQEESMSQITKKALAASLKGLLAKMPLDKITIMDIVEDCGVNRQTFYYHFHDIYDLTEWIFLSDASVVIGGKKTYATWQQGFSQVFTYVQENKSLVLNVYYSVSRDQVERFLYDVTYDLLAGVVEEKAAGLSVREEDKRFIADFYKFAFVGLMLDWIRRGMKDDPEAIIGRLSMLIQGDISRALQKYALNAQ